MILVDTSVWVSYFRDGNAAMAELLNNGDVACHPFIIGELACGNLKNRNEILALLQLLPQIPPAEHGEVMHFIERNRLMGKGLGYIDVHLAAAATLATVPIWTLDKCLDDINKELGISYKL
jgi:predicted nucleic acid-binding protein